MATLVGSCNAPQGSQGGAVAGIAPAGEVGKRVERVGDEIVVCGQLFHIGAPVVLWMDPGGYDGYRVERRFVDYEKASWEATTQSTDRSKPQTPNRYNLRVFGASEEDVARARSGWTLEELRPRIDQFVYHYDVCGTSRQCFKVLHDLRGLSVHFMLDLDGTIYQTLDLKERAWHATTSNTRSIGIEIANMGAYSMRANSPLDEWYVKGPDGRTMIRIPSRFGDGGIRDKSVVLRPARDGIVTGQVQGRTYHMYDLTPQQYQSLIKLTAALCTIFPNMPCDYPRDSQGKLILEKLPEDRLSEYRGLLGHFHVQKDKQDPGPAFDWEKVISGARALMK